MSVTVEIDFVMKKLSFRQPCQQLKYHMWNNKNLVATTMQVDSPVNLGFHEIYIVPKLKPYY